jgi:hypothetical protein
MGRLLRISIGGTTILSISSRGVERALIGGAAAALCVATGGAAAPAVASAFTTGAISSTVAHNTSKGIKDPVVKAVVGGVVGCGAGGLVSVGALGSSLATQGASYGAAEFAKDAGQVIAGTVVGEVTGVPELGAFAGGAFGSTTPVKSGTSSATRVFVGKTVSKAVPNSTAGQLVSAAYSGAVGNAVESAFDKPVPVFDVNNSKHRSPVGKRVYDEPIGPTMRPVYTEPIGPTMRPVYDSPIGPSIAPVYTEPIGPYNVPAFNGNSCKVDSYFDTPSGKPISVINCGNTRVQINSVNSSVNLRQTVPVWNDTKIGSSVTVGSNGSSSGIVTQSGSVVKECGGGVDYGSGWDNEVYGYCNYTTVLPENQVPARVAQAKLSDYKEDIIVPIVGKVGSVRQTTTATAKTITTQVRYGLNVNGVSTVVPVGASAKTASLGGKMIINSVGKRIVVPTVGTSLVTAMP